MQLLYKKFLVNTGAIPRVEVGADVKQEDSENVRLKCFWNSPGNLTNVVYQVRWFADDKDPEITTEKNFTGLEPAEFLLGPEVVNGKKSENPHYKFHKHVGQSFFV